MESNISIRLIEFFAYLLPGRIMLAALIYRLTRLNYMDDMAQSIWVLESSPVNKGRPRIRKEIRPMRRFFLPEFAATSMDSIQDCPRITLLSTDLKLEDLQSTQEGVS